MPAILARALPAIVIAGILILAYYSSASLRELVSAGRASDRARKLFVLILGIAVLIILVSAALSTK